VSGVTRAVPLDRPETGSRLEGAAAPALVPLVRRLDGAADPLALYAALTNGGRQADTMLLESADSSGLSGTRSLIIARSLIRLTCRGNDVLAAPLSPNGAGLASRLPRRFDALPPSGTIEERRRLLAPGPLDALRAAVSFAAPGQEAAFPGNFAAGILSYDLAELFERLPQARLDPDSFPHFIFWVPDRVIAIDHRRGTTTVQAMAAAAEGPSAYHDAARDVERMARTVEEVGARTVQPPPPAPPARTTCDLSDAQFAALVRTLQRRVRAGDVFQVVPSRTFSLPCDDPLGAYARLRASNPSPYQFFVRAPGFTLLGASPETAVTVTGTPRRVIVPPIAGTAPRGRTPHGDVDADHDARLQAALMTHPKELAEHMMLVDLARNDVARVSRPGTRIVSRLLEVERYRHVMHLVSEVTGELDDGLDALHAWAGCMNLGTVVGAPKIRAAELLRLHETSRRGAYGGAVGYLAHDGSLDTALVIRSAMVADGVARVRAGAGVVLDSDPDGEADETRRKAAAVLQAIGSVDSA